MTRTVARPDQVDLDSPGRRDYWVALEHDSIWGDHLIPLTVMVGPEAQASHQTPTHFLKANQTPTGKANQTPTHFLVNETGCGLNRRSCGRVQGQQLPGA